LAKLKAEAFKKTALKYRQLLLGGQLYLDHLFALFLEVFLAVFSLGFCPFSCFKFWAIFCTISRTVI
jgi:hypothetical protein